MNEKGPVVADSVCNIGHGLHSRPGLRQPKAANIISLNGILA